MKLRGFLVRTHAIAYCISCKSAGSAWGVSFQPQVDSKTLREVPEILRDVEEGHPAPSSPALDSLLLDPLDGLPAVLRFLPEE